MKRLRMLGIPFILLAMGYASILVFAAYSTKLPQVLSSTISTSVQTSFKVQENMVPFLKESAYIEKSGSINIYVSGNGKYKSKLNMLSKNNFIMKDITGELNSVNESSGAYIYTFDNVKFTGPDAAITIPRGTQFDISGDKLDRDIVVVNWHACMTEKEMSSELNKLLLIVFGGLIGTILFFIICISIEGALFKNRPLPNVRRALIKILVGLISSGFGVGIIGLAGGTLQIEGALDKIKDNLFVLIPILMILLGILCILWTIVEDILKMGMVTGAILFFTELFMVLSVFSVLAVFLGAPAMAGVKVADEMKKLG